MIELLKRRRDDNGSLCYHFFQCSIRCPNVFSIFSHSLLSTYILPFNLHKIMFIFWMSNVFLILPWYLFFRQCCLLSGILAESSVYFRRKNYSGLREYSAYIFVEVVVYVFPPPAETMNMAYLYYSAQTLTSSTNSSIGKIHRDSTSSCGKNQQKLVAPK